MRFFAIFLALATSLKQQETVHAFSLSMSSSSSKKTNVATTNTASSRRDALFEFGKTTAGFVIAAATIPTEVAFAVTSGGASKFVGTFTDPINHPGGKRTIQLLEETVGDYRLAEVLGGGGRGEPANYVLPAAVIGDRTIVIDFSPKGGPRDFVGQLDDKGNIRFLRDGNVWPRQ